MEAGVESMGTHQVALEINIIYVPSQVQLKPVKRSLICLTLEMTWT